MALETNDIRNYIISCSNTTGMIYPDNCSNIIDNDLNTRISFCSNQNNIELSYQLNPSYTYQGINFSLFLADTNYLTANAYPRSVELQLGKNNVYTTIFKNETVDTSSSCGGVFNPRYMIKNNTDDYFDSIKIIIRPKTRNPLYCGGTCDTSKFYFNIGDFNISVNSYSNNHSNSYPEAKLNNQKSLYCLNTSSNIFNFYLNMTDTENDDMLYYNYWDGTYANEVIVDDFSDPDYSMSENGWAFNSSGCNYSTAEGFLELYNGCQNKEILKILDNSNLPTDDFNINFLAFASRNTTNVYDIWNYHNEKVTGLLIERFYDNSYNALYYNFSYWTGSSYVYFGSSYYTGLLDVQYIFNGSHNRICINGLDEASATGCNDEVYAPLSGITDNTPAKFRMAPTYNFMWEEYEPSYVILDNLEFSDTYVNWQNYNGIITLSNIFEGNGNHILTVLATDNAHEPKYKKYDFPFTIYGDCALQVQHNLTNEFNFTHGAQDYLNAIDQGKAKFDWIFYIGLLVVFIWLLLMFRDIAITLLLESLIMGSAALMLSGDIIQIASAFSLFAFGLALIITKSM